MEIASGWGNSKQAAASAGAFIAINSLSGLIGRFANGTFSLGEFGIPLLGVLAGRADRQSTGRGQVFRRGRAPRPGDDPDDCSGNLLGEIPVALSDV
jgi:hypothetical protein